MISRVDSVGNIYATTGAISQTPVARVGFKGDDEANSDTLEIKKPSTTTAKKQQILKEATQKAAGWGILFGGLASIVYIARADRKVAGKYGLDVKEDRKFIKQIKEQQALFALPGMIALVGGVISYFYCRGRDPEDLLVK